MLVAIFRTHPKSRVIFLEILNSISSTKSSFQTSQSLSFQVDMNFKGTLLNPLKWKVKVLVSQSCPILCNSMDCSLPGSFIHGILQSRIPEWVAIPFSRGSSWPRPRSNLGLLQFRQILNCLSNSIATPRKAIFPTIYGTKFSSNGSSWGHAPDLWWRSWLWSSVSLEPHGISSQGHKCSTLRRIEEDTSMGESWNKLTSFLREDMARSLETLCFRTEWTVEVVWSTGFHSLLQMRNEKDKYDWRPLDLTVSEGHSVWGQVLPDLNLGSRRHPESRANQMGTGEHRSSKHILQ